MTINDPTYIGLGGLGGIANGQSAESNALNYGWGGSKGTSWNDAENSSWGNNFSDAYGSAYGNSWGYGLGENWSRGSSWQQSENQSWNNAENTSWGNGENRSWNAVYGSEASAKDVQRAAEANAMQDYFARQQMAYNAMETQKARDYAEYMSNTSYQRAVADLKAAGLNPILAALNMGASTPTIGSASAGLSSAYKANTYADQYGGSYGYNNSGSYGYSNGGSYGYSRGRSNQESYGYSKNESGSNYLAQNRSHAEGYSGSRGWSHGGSNESSSNFNYGQSKSKSTNNIRELVQGLGDLLSGFTSAFKNLKPAGFDGYDVPLNY